MPPRNETVAQIIAEARAMIEERGEQGLRVAELAERCGVAVGLLYHYFADRRALIAAVREDQFIARVESDIQTLKRLSTTGNNADIVDVVVNQFSDPRNDERLRYRLQRMEVLVAASRDPELLERIREVQGRFVAEIVETIRNVKKTGFIREDLDERSFALLLEILPLGATLGMVYGENLPDPDAWRAFINRFLAAALTPPKKK